MLESVVRCSRDNAERGFWLNPPSLVSWMQNYWCRCCGSFTFWQSSLQVRNRSGFAEIVLCLILARKFFSSLQSVIQGGNAVFRPNQPINFKLSVMWLSSFNDLSILTSLFALLFPQRINIFVSLSNVNLWPRKGLFGSRKVRSWFVKRTCFCKVIGRCSVNHTLVLLFRYEKYHTWLT